jgi:hypothetical protein
MTGDVETVQKKDTIPLWLAVAITVVVSLPFGVWLSRWNLPIWVSFIVWAEYFALGAKASALIKIVPAYLSGVGVAAAIMTLYLWLTKVFGTTHWLKPNDLALAVAAFAGFCVFIYAMKYIPFWRDNTLPFFNGISMGLAVFFTGAFVHPFPAVVSVYALPWMAAAGAALAGLLGAFLGWFNVTITFPREVRVTAPQAEMPAVVVPDTPAPLLSTDESALPPPRPEIVPPADSPSRHEATS